MRRPPLAMMGRTRSCSHAASTPIHLTYSLSPSPSKWLVTAVHNTAWAPCTSTLCVSNFCLHEVAETIASMLDYMLICESGYVARLSRPSANSGCRTGGLTRTELDRDYFSTMSITLITDQLGCPSNDHLAL